MVNLTRAIDPTRPIIESSGGFHGVPRPDALDTHDYDQNPASFRQRWTESYGPGATLPARYRTGQSWRCLPFFLSEYGGIGWGISGGWGYGVPENLEGFYTRFQGLTDALLDNRYIFGYCYTQLTDVEQEQNGMYFYNRKPKFDAQRLRRIQSRPAAYEKDPPLAAPGGSRDDWRVLVGAVPDGPLARPWRYTVESPPGAWTSLEFDDGAWKPGQAGFGQKGGWEPSIKTPWSSKDIWLRRQFPCSDASFARAMLVIHYDNGTEVYVNGKPLWKGERWNDAYAGFDVTKTLKQALRQGTNTIAIHCHQDEGGQFIDAAVLVSDR